MLYKHSANTSKYKKEKGCNSIIINVKYYIFKSTLDMSEFQSSDRPSPNLVEENKFEVDKITGEHEAGEKRKIPLLSELLNQIQKQSTRQAKIEKTLASLDKSMIQIRDNLEKPGDHMEQHHQQLQQHQVLEESIKQIQSQLSDLQKQLTMIDSSISNIVTNHTTTILRVEIRKKVRKISRIRRVKKVRRRSSVTRNKRDTRVKTKIKKKNC